MWPFDLSKAFTLEVADFRAREIVDVTVLAVRMVLTASLPPEPGPSCWGDRDSRRPLMLLDSSRQALLMEDMTGLGEDTVGVTYGRLSEPWAPGCGLPVVTEAAPGAAVPPGPGVPPPPPPPPPPPCRGRAASVTRSYRASPPLSTAWQSPVFPEMSPTLRILMLLQFTPQP